MSLVGGVIGVGDLALDVVDAGDVAGVVVAGNDARQSVGAVQTINGPLGLQATFTGNSGTAFRYTPDGRLISAGLPDGTNRYYTTDNLGNVTAVATDSAITAQYSYDPYGGLRASSGAEAGNNPMRYGQGYTDTATGLVKLGIRYYDAAQGRFTQQDPTGQDFQFLYSGNAPETFNDPSGAKISLGDIGAVVGGLAASAGAAALCVGSVGIGCAVVAGAVLGGVGGALGGSTGVALSGGSKKEIQDSLVNNAILGAVSGAGGPIVGKAGEAIGKGAKGIR